MKVAIVCGSPSSEMLAPFENKEYEIWVLGNRIQNYKGKRVTRIFEIHENLNEHGDVNVYRERLVRTGLPLVVGENFKADYKGEELVTEFPYKSSEELYGSLYLTSSPAYMLAFAILQGATDIAIYGVDLSISDHEYFWQRPCVEAWIGFAKGRGIKVTIPEVSHVGKSSYVEGRDWGNETDVGVFSQENFGAMAADHRTRNQELQNQRRALALDAAMHEGAAQAYDNMAKVARAVEAKIDINSLKETTLVR